MPEIFFADFCISCLVLHHTYTVHQILWLSELTTLYEIDDYLALVDIARSVFLEFKLTFASLFSKGISQVEEKFAPPSFLDCKAELQTSHQVKSLIGILVHFR